MEIATQITVLRRPVGGPCRVAVAASVRGLEAEQVRAHVPRVRGEGILEHPTLECPLTPSA
jgi:hypothetical protein